jgi:hypothetical protein
VTPPSLTLPEHLPPHPHTIHRPTALGRVRLTANADPIGPQLLAFPRSYSKRHLSPTSVHTSLFACIPYRVLQRNSRICLKLSALTYSPTKGFTAFPGSNKTPWPQSASELYRPSDRLLPAKLVTTFADIECHVVGVTDLLRPYSRFSRPEPQLFLPSSSSIVLTRLSGPRSRPTTSQKIW